MTKPWLTRLFILLLAGLLLVPPLALRARDGAAPDAPQRLADLPQVATPAWWVVTDPRQSGGAGRLYLLGTVHVLPEGMDWSSPALEAAFTASDVLLTELSPEEMQPEVLVPIVMEMAFLAEGEQLQDRIGEALFRQLAEALDGFGIPPQATARMRPWFAGLTLATQTILRAGLDPEKGVDKQLHDLALARAMPVAGLESARAQLAKLAEGDGRFAEAMVREGVELAQDPQAELAGLIANWGSGQPERLYEAFVAPVEALSPEMVRSVLYDRNHAWMPALRAQMASGRTAFVAVGAAHMVGEEGLVALLQAEGFQVHQQAAL